MTPPLNVSIKSVKRLQLERQGINNFPRRVTKKSIYDVVDRLGCIQIDTINVVERAHYLTIWTRLRSYDRKHLYDIAYKDRRIFEGWGHAMCYMPLKDYRYLINANNERSQDSVIHKGWFSRVDSETIEIVRQRIKTEGPLSSADFEGKKSSSGWWGWKPAKRALEALFSAGELMITRRDGFKRVYDLTERVLPSWVDVSEPTEEERIRFFALRTMGCLGVIKPQDIRFYYHNWCVKLGKTSKELQIVLDELVKEKVAVNLKVEGLRQPYYCLTEDIGQLENLEEDWDFDGVKFVNYFDSLLWQADRLKEFFVFERVLEVYLKPQQRRFGYFTIPILYRDGFIGRLDPKLERKEKKLIIRGLWYENGFKLTEEYEDEFQRTLESFTKFIGAEKVVWHLEKMPTSV